MQLKHLLPAALASTAVAQNMTGNMSLTAALASQPSLSTLTGLLMQNPSLVQALSSASNITILAPSNDALGAVLNNTNASMALSQPGVLQAVLTYHVLNGSYPASAFGNTSMFIPTFLTNSSYSNVTGGQRVQAVAANGGVSFFSALKQNVSVVTPNVNFTGGVIHIINGLLSVPGNDSATLQAANLTAAVGALRTANNLQNTLNAARDLTILAPNNDAFAAIGSITANTSAAALGQILGYHVINGTVAYSTMLAGMNGTNITTAAGANLTVTVGGDGSIFVNSARVTVPDVLVANGVVHVLNQVLNPASPAASPNTSASAAPTPAFSGASSGTAGVPFTSGVVGPTSVAPAATSAAGGSGPRSSSSSAVAAQHVPAAATGAVGAAALFGLGAMMVQF